MSKFEENYTIQEKSFAVSDTILAKYSHKVPEYLTNLWKSEGFGKYNDGLIELINPEDFTAVLWTWLGGEKDNYTPFAISAFGELFYYRKLTETDEDVCMLDIQFRNIENLEWSLESFFENFLTDVANRQSWLREDLFNEAIATKGHLEKNEIFTFTPMLALGGAEELSYLGKGNAQVYQDLVFQMTL